MTRAPIGEAYADLADRVFSAVQEDWQDPHRLHLYLARVALDHGDRALAALAAGDRASARAHLMAYRRIRHGLTQDGYWEPNVALQVSIGG